MKDLLPKIKVHLDWKAYFKAFSEAHGGNPVPFAGRLLFADGWTYSSTDYAGPEWPPAPARLKILQKAYWTIRRRIVETQRDQLRNMLQGLRELQSGKSVPLQHTVKFTDEEGKKVQRSDVLDLEAFNGRLHWLEQDAAECTSKLQELGALNGQDTHQRQTTNVSAAV